MTALPVQGPGLGWNNDYGYWAGNQFLGIGNIPQQGHNYQPYIQQPSNNTSGGGGGQVLGQQSQQSSGPSEEELARQRYENEARNAINSGYSNYFAQLDALLAGLSGQQTAQNDLVNSQYAQGLSDLSGQRSIGLGDLAYERGKTEASQKRNLANLAESLRNQFMTGQVMLGARGAGDSSATNQYSYALSKLGNKARGGIMTNTADIMADIGNREFKLNTIYNTEVNRLGAERDQKIASISQWFYEQQNNIGQMKASGELNKGQDLANLSQNLLNYAMNQLSQVNAEHANQRAMLDEWVVNNSNSIEQAKQGIAENANYTANPTQFAGIQGTPTWDVGGNLQANIAPVGYNYNTSEDKYKQTNWA